MLQSRYLHGKERMEALSIYPSPVLVKHNA